MRRLRFALPAVLLLAAVSSAAATQANPQAPPPATPPPARPPVATAPSAPGVIGYPATRVGEIGLPAMVLDGRADAPEAREMAEVRDRLWREALGQYPASVGRSLQLDPLLLSDDDFLARYPQLEAFLKEHPEVRLNQRYFFPALSNEEANSSSTGVVVGGIIGTLIPLGFFTLMGGVAYLLHQRSRAAIQARQETTAKLIDGLLAREDLVSHLDTPAGRRLLGSLDRQPEPAPASRIIRSVRTGIVLVFVGIGFIMMQGRFNQTLSAQMATAGTLVGMAGLGFLISAGASYLLSRRFGLLQTPDTRD